jgi:transposase-like protein
MNPASKEQASAVICKNPLCMKIFVVPSEVSFKRTATAKLKCPSCKHEHEYRRKDFHEASGPNGIALNPV